MIRVASWLLFVASLPALAAVNGGGPTYTAMAGGQRVEYTGASAAFMGSRSLTTPSSSGIGVTDSIAFLGPVGLPISGAVATRAFSVPLIARAAMSACTVQPTLCLIGGGMAIGAWLDHTLRVREATQAGKPAGTGLYEDPGVNPGTNGGGGIADYGCYWTNGSPASKLEGQCGSKASYAQAHCEGAIETYLKSQFGSQYDGVWNGSQCNAVNAGNSTNLWYAWVSEPDPEGGGGGSLCPGYVDPVTGPVAQGFASPGADGKCPTGTYTGKTLEQLQAEFEANPPSQNNTALGEMYDAFNAWLGSGVACASCTPPAVAVTGLPATIQGQTTTTTTTAPDGTTTAVESPVFAPVWNQFGTSGCQTLSALCGKDGVVRFPKTTTTTTTFTPSSGPNAGIPQVTTSTTTDTATTTNPLAEQAPTQCDKFPDTLGCGLLGTPTTDAPVWVEKPVTYTPETFIAGNGSCPADTTYQLTAGVSAVVKWTPFCNIAPQFRLFLLACVSAMAAYFIVQQTTRT